MAALVKRTWVYVQRPREYEMAPCSCGNADPDWSEFVKHLWCKFCKKDFVPEHPGVFDGPVPMHVAHLLGMQFDRLNLETWVLERLDLDTGEYKACGRWNRETETLEPV